MIVAFRFILAPEYHIPWHGGIRLNVNRFLVFYIIIKLKRYLYCRRTGIGKHKKKKKQCVTIYILYAYDHGNIVNSGSNCDNIILVP